MPVIVSDAGPLIAMSRIRRVELLSGLFHEVVISKAVLDELRLGETRPGVESLAAAIAQGDWLRTGISASEARLFGLDAGETSAIALAEEMRCPLLIDERRGRVAARRRGIQVIGTGRVLVAAKDRRLLNAVEPVLQELRKSGYRLSDRLCRRIIVLAGEGSRGHR